jgi:hypothetical protein
MKFKIYNQSPITPNAQYTYIDFRVKSTDYRIVFVSKIRFLFGWKPHKNERGYAETVQEYFDLETLFSSLNFPLTPSEIEVLRLHIISFTLFSWSL